MDLWQVGLIAVVVVGLGLIVFGALYDRARNRRRAREMMSPPPRSIPQFDADARPPDYVSDLQARRPPPDATTSALTADERAAVDRQLADARTLTVKAGYVSPDFVTDPEPGWAVLEHPAVLVCADPVESIRELLPGLERAITTRTPLVLLAPEIAPGVLATLEVNTIQRRMRLLAVTPGPAELADLAAACRATPVDRSDRQAGYLPAEHLGTCERWVSTARTSHVITAAEVTHPR